MSQNDAETYTNFQQVFETIESMKDDFGELQGNLQHQKETLQEEHQQVKKETQELRNELLQEFKEQIQVHNESANAHENHFQELLSTHDSQADAHAVQFQALHSRIQESEAFLSTFRELPATLEDLSNRDLSDTESFPLEHLLSQLHNHSVQLQSKTQEHEEQFQAWKSQQDGLWEQQKDKQQTELALLENQVQIVKDELVNFHNQTGFQSEDNERLSTLEVRFEDHSLRLQNVWDHMQESRILLEEQERAITEHAQALVHIIKQLASLYDKKFEAFQAVLKKHHESIRLQAQKFTEHARHPKAHYRLFEQINHCLAEHITDPDGHGYNSEQELPSVDHGLIPQGDENTLEQVETEFVGHSKDKQVLQEMLDEKILAFQHGVIDPLEDKVNEVHRAYRTRLRETDRLDSMNERDMALLLKNNERNVKRISQLMRAERRTRRTLWFWIAFQLLAVAGVALYLGMSSL